SGGAAVEARSLRPRPLLRTHGHRQGKGRDGLLAPGRGARLAKRGNLDDRKFAEIRYQSSARSRLECGAGAPPAYLGSGAPGIERGCERTAAAGGEVFGSAD